MQTIYLDYNATTPLAPRAREAMLPFLGEQFGNPSSSHALGRASREAVEGARERVALLLGCDASELVFTSGGTESNNHALLGALRARSEPPRGHLVISACEHPATVEPARYLQRLGCELTVVPCDRHGVVDPDAVAAALRSETALVSIMHANNEIGTLQPIAEIARHCRQRGVLVHTDAAQSAGKIPVRVEVLGIDLLSIAGHKLYAPKGVGALYVRQGTPLGPLLHGAGQESGRRPGTENVASIVALGEAAALATDEMESTRPHLALLRDRLETRLRGGIGDGISVNGAGAERLPNTLSVNFPGVRGSALLGRAPELYASTGAACHADQGAGERVQMSDTLRAIGLPPEVARGTVRLSTGRYTTEEEVDRAASALLAAWESLQ